MSSGCPTTTDTPVQNPSTMVPTADEYRDFSRVSNNDIRKEIPLPVSSRKGFRGGVIEPFPNRLHRVLKEVADAGMDHIISWEWHGRSFVIRNRDAFTEHIMKKYFSQSQLSSFQRQLNMYGFRRLTIECTGPQEFFHELFLQSRPDIADCIFRLKNRTRNHSKMKSFPCPKFEAYPSCSWRDTSRYSVVSDQSDELDDLESVGTIDFDSSEACLVDPNFDFSVLGGVASSTNQIEDWSCETGAITVCSGLATAHPFKNAYSVRNLGLVPMFPFFAGRTEVCRQEMHYPTHYDSPEVGMGGLGRALGNLTSSHTGSSHVSWVDGFEPLPVFPPSASSPANEDMRRCSVQWMYR